MPANTFDLTDLDDVVDVAESPPENELKTWVDEQLTYGKGPLNPIVWDIETGPRVEAELRELYHEKTPEEFAATCDKRWKPETVQAKHKEYLKTAWEEFVGKAALSPATGRVLLIGLLVDGKFDSIGQAKSEADALVAFWDVVLLAIDDRRPLIGHNSNGFDLPFLIRRSWILGVPVPREVRQGRYWHPLFRDTMEHWACGSREFVSLNTLGQLFGVGQKTEGVEGRDFHRLWFGMMPAEEWGTPEEQRAKAIEYCEQDVRLTAAIAEKMGMV